MAAPIITVVGDKGYVWDAAVAMDLRKKHRIVGTMVGGIATLKNQNVICGLPLQLSQEEVALATEQGWLQVAPSTQLNSVLDIVSVADIEQVGSKRKRTEPTDLGPYPNDDLEDYYSACYSCSDEEEPVKQLKESSAPYWQTALATEGAFELPLHNLEAPNTTTVTGASTNPGSECTLTGGTSNPEDPCSSHTPVQLWRFPETTEQKLRYAVFRDLHSRGFCMTGGSKFGADYLVYPGDPSLYHAQFTVRLLPWGTALQPMLLKSWARGSHAARKHLLLATMDPAELEAGRLVPQYISLAPEEGFGS